MGGGFDCPGVFCMTFEDFHSYFETTYTCKYNESDKHSFEFVNYPAPELSFFEFTLTQAFIDNTRGIDFFVNQMGDRLKQRRR